MDPTTPSSTPEDSQNKEATEQRAAFLMQKLERLGKEIDHLQQKVGTSDPKSVVERTADQKPTTKMGLTKGIFKNPNAVARKNWAKLDSLHAERIETADELLALRGCMFVHETDGAPSSLRKNPI